MTESDLLKSQTLLNELLNEDKNSKINSLRCLPLLTSSIDPKVTREVLIPFLATYIKSLEIPENSQEYEVLIALAEEIPKVIPYMGGNEHNHLLLLPLESLLSSEEYLIREKAIASTLCISETLDLFQTEEYLVPIIRNLCSCDWPLSKSSVCPLFPIAYQKVSNPIKTELIQLYSQLLLDDAPLIRRAACGQFKKFVVHIDPESFKNSILKNLKILAEDDQDSVRLLLIEGYVSVCSILGDSDKNELILPLIQESVTDISWRVRLKSASNFASICKVMGPELTYNEFTHHFVELLKDEEPEVRNEAASEITKLASLLDFDTFQKDIIPCIYSLINDSNQYVRATLAENVMELAQVFGKDIVQHLLNIFLQLLKDNYLQVKLNILSKIDNIAGYVAIETLSLVLIPAISELAEDKKWRVRLVMIECLPLLAKKLGVEIFDEKLTCLCLKWLGDPIYLIRETATENIYKLTDIFGQKWAEAHVIPRILDLLNHPTYLYRITSLYTIMSLVNFLEKNVITNTLISAVLNLSHDSVPNVRFTVAKTLQTLAPLLEDPELNILVSSTLERLKGDQDTDVCHFATIAYETCRKQSN